MVYNVHVCFVIIIKDIINHKWFIKGQPSGEAFIQMNSEGASFNAATHKNNKYMFFNGKKTIY